VTETADRYARVAGAFDARVKAVPDNRWGATAPCQDWQARDVVVHVVNNQRRLIAQSQGGQETVVTDAEDPMAAWADAFGQMVKLTNDESAMAKVVDGPIGPMPLGQIIDNFNTMDVLIHTWDLARAVGGDEQLDPGEVRRVKDALTPMDAMIRQPGVFGPKLEPPAGADEQTSLLYFLGRQA
jgi:uncharacterized protein (TIGR03086 family)